MDEKDEGDFARFDIKISLVEMPYTETTVYTLSAKVEEYFSFGHKLECTARLIYFYTFFEMLNTFLLL